MAILGLVSLEIDEDVVRIDVPVIRQMRNVLLEGRRQLLQELRSQDHRVLNVSGGEGGVGEEWVRGSSNQWAVGLQSCLSGTILKHPERPSGTREHNESLVEWQWLTPNKTL